MYEQKRVSYWVPIIIVMVLISLIVVYTQSNNQMQVYQGDTTVPTTSPTVPALKVEMEQYSHDTYALTYSVPADWTRVVKDGYETYIHAPSASSFQIQIKPYAPMILTVSAASTQAELQNAGFTMLSFDHLSATDYTVLYQSDTTTYIEIVSFDKKTILNMVYTMPTEHAARMMETIAVIIDSVQWEREYPYPKDMGLVYSDFGSFEFAYPAQWRVGIQNNTYIAQDQNGGAVMAIMCNESAANYATTTQLDYVNFAGSGRSNYALQSYQSTSSTIYAVSTYSAGETNMVLVHYMVATGTHEYMVVFEIPYDTYNTYEETVADVLSLLKIYKEAN